MSSSRIVIMFKKVFEKAKHIYEHHYKKLLILPALLLLLAIIQITAQYATTGDFVNRGVSLKGGSAITITETGVSALELEELLRDQFPQLDVGIDPATTLQ